MNSQSNPLAEPIVIVAIIGFVQAVTLTLLGLVIARLGRVNKNTKATKDQIVNHHPEQPNFREENDRRHAETRQWFMTIFRKVSNVEKTVHARIDALNLTVNDLLTGFIENRERIETLEETDRKQNDR